MVTKGIFWKRFYFVVSLLLCNCFLLCCNGFCDRVKKLFGWGQSGITNGYDQDGNPIDNINNNSNEEGENSEENSDSSSNKGENSEENSDSSSKEEMENSEEDNNNSNEVKNSEEDNNNSNEVKNSEEDSDSSSNKGENSEENSDIGETQTLKCKKLKYVFVSDTTCVGKTSILKYLQDKKFEDEYKATVSIDSFLKETNTEISNKKIKMKIQMWDCSADKVYKSLIVSFLNNVDAIVFVYDITNAESFNNLGGYITEVQGNASEGCLFFLLGNKLDLVEQNQNERRVTTKEAQKLAGDNKLIFLGECSAKNNTYMPVQELYCKQEGLVENEKCNEDLSGILDNIVYNIRVKSKIE